MTTAVPLPFGPRPNVSITPNRSLRDGQTVRLTGVNLVPGQTVHVWECQDYGYLCTKWVGESAVVDAHGWLRSMCS